MKQLHKQIKNVIQLSIVLLSFTMAGTISMTAATRIHCSEDTVKVSRILEKLQSVEPKLGARIVAAAEELVGTPWSNPADNDSIGTIVIDLHGFDRMGFVNTALGLAKASLHHVPTERQYELAYESYSRRKGEDDGFVSRLFYGSDWVVDNIYRGNLKDLTEYIGGGGFKAKTLDYMSRHEDEFPAMKNQEVKDKIQMIEMGYRSHRIPHLKKQSIGNKEIREMLENGDIIIMLSNDVDYDVYDMGIVKMKDGNPYLIHISHDSGKVVEDPYPMSRLFKLEAQHFYGYRWLRPDD